MRRLAFHLLLATASTLLVLGLCWHRSLLDSLPKTPPLTEDERLYGLDPAARARFKTRLPEEIKVGPTFRDAIAGFNQIPGVAVECPFDLIERLGVPRDTPVSEDVGGLTVKEALAKVLARVSNDRVSLAARYIPDFLVIDTAGSAAIFASTQVSYDVRRLLPSALSEVQAAAWAIDADVRREVAPESWHKPARGGGVGGLYVNAVPGQLDVDHTPEVQQEVKRWVERRIWYANLRYHGVKAVPYAVAVALVVMSVHVVMRVRASRLQQLWGRCAACGYDLRATPDRCPECGAVPLRVAAAAVVAGSA